MILKQDETQRKGRGFSPNELEKAGINKLQAKQLSLPVDYRRKTAHDENVETIKAHASNAEALKKLEPKPTAETKATKKAKS